jgi:hypothetical protein
MKPEAGDILGTAADQLMGQIAPNLNAHYLQGSLAVQALLLKFAAREYERGADIRFAENADMRALFAELAPNIGDAALRAQLTGAAATRDKSLTISALNAANAELRRLLIALQVHLEDLGDRAAQKRIWDALNVMASRRVVSLF